MLERSRKACGVLVSHSAAPRNPPNWLAAGSRHGGVRHLHKGHVGATLEKLDLPRMPWLKEVDQAPEKSAIRRFKDQHLREVGLIHEDMRGLFKDDKPARRAIEKVPQQELLKDAESSSAGST